MLNYETKWMTRHEIVESTYQSALRLNHVKHKHALIKHRRFKEIEGRINRAQGIIRQIDEELAKQGSTEGQAKTGRQDNVEDANSSVRDLKTSTICDKDELKWPVRFLKLNLPGGSLKLLALLRIKNIISLILRGDDLPPRDERRAL